MCLSQPTAYECSINGASILQLRVLDASGAQFGDAVVYIKSLHSVGRKDSISTQFDTVLVNNDDPLVANITFIPVMSLNNYTVQCAESLANDIPVNCSIQIAGMNKLDTDYIISLLDVPGAPVPNDIDFTTTNLTFSWSSSSNSTCFSHYSVSVNSINSYNTISTTNTSLTLPIFSLNDTEYSISVVTVDTGGRYMNPQGVRTFIVNGK